MLLISALLSILCGHGQAQEVQPSRTDQCTIGQNTFTGISPRHRKNRVKDIWSSNKNFHAAMDLDRCVTTVYTVNWRGNVGRSEEFWRLDRSFESAWLSNDGQHLTAGHYGEGRLPLDYDEDQVMLVFFRRGELVREVALLDLIAHGSELQETDAGYSWGRYLGFNSAGYFVVQPIGGKYILFDPSTGKPAKFKGRATRVLPNWQLFQDVMRCFEFQYPPSFTLKEHLSIHGTPTGWNSIKNQDEGWIIRTSVEDMAAHGSPFPGLEKASFREFVMSRVKAMFCADGPYSSRHVKEAATEKRFTSSNDVAGLELFLREVHETWSDGDEVTTEERTIGPVYAMSISQPGESHRVLFFEINYDRPVSREKMALLKGMVDTVRILE